MIRSVFNQDKMFAMSLTDIFKRTIVYRYTPKRSPFDRTAYIEDYVPRPTKYHKDRKPRLPQWDDPNVHWPPVLAAPTQHKYKALMKELEAEEKLRLDLSKPFDVPDFRPGDVVEFSYIHSVSEGKGNTLTGIVTRRRRRNSLDHAFQISARFRGSQISFYQKVSSPMLTSFRLVAKGSGYMKSHLHWIPEAGWSKEQQMRPMMRRGMSKRKDEAVRQAVVSKRSKNILEDIKDDLLR
mmetsp:Transcript_39457/g.45903  ORF Transcript_39457/g.45903 Transcript_39457/m.45903 type:complete len:238 (-) Transcript_39457:101-814(-)